MSRKTDETGRDVLDEQGRVIDVCDGCGVEGVGVAPRGGMCPDCYANHFYCPRCGYLRPNSENRGAYCRECKSEYNRQYYLSHRGLI